MSVPSPRLSQLQRAITGYRQSLLTLDDAALTALQESYQPSRVRLLNTVTELTAQIGNGQKLTTTEAMELGRARELLRLVDVEAGRIAKLTGEIVPSAQAEAVEQAIARARTLTIAQGVDARAASRVAARWTTINTNAVADLVGSLSDGSPLSSWIERVVPDSVQTVKDTLLDGVTRGIHPEALAKRLSAATDLPLERAMTMARTETLRAYRSAGLESMRQNADILSGWTWSAAHGPRTCNACLALSGRDFPLTVAFMASHVRCRCSPLPRLKDDSLLPSLQTGEEWFNAQPREWQRERFPVGLRGDFDAGRVGIQDMASLRHDDVWGDSYQVSSIPEARRQARSRRSGGERIAAGGR